MIVDDLSVNERARAWRRAVLDGVCDGATAWEHGSVILASRYPTYWSYNFVAVEDDPGLTCAELIAFADQALGDLDHRAIEFNEIEPAQRLRRDFDAAGWRSTRLVWMHHEHAPEIDSTLAVEDVPYEAVRALRIAWHEEDYPGDELGGHLEEAREVDELHGARVLAHRDGGAITGFSQLERIADGALIGAVYVDREHRGGGIGTALTLAAIAAAGAVGDLWILADDEDRPKELYARLGFRPVWTTMVFLRLPKR